MIDDNLCDPESQGDGLIKAKETKDKKIKIKKSNSSKDDIFNKKYDLPENLDSISSVVDDKGISTGYLLVKARDRRDNEIYAKLGEKELALGRCDALAHFAVKARLTGYLSPKGLRTLAATVMECVSEEVYVASHDGYHELMLKGQRYGFYVIGQKAYFFTDAPKLRVKVVNENAFEECASGDFDSWYEAIGKHLVGNPYALVSVMAALASAFARAFGMVTPILMIVAPSSVGKTTLQQIARSVRERADKVDDASGTTNGLRLKMECSPDAPVFLQDAHKVEDIPGFMGLLFLVANGGQRLTSTADQKVNAGTALSCGLSLSSEMTFMEMVGNSKMSLPEGFSARCFEMVLQGPYGAFHKLPKGVKAHDFANALKRACSENYGVIWTEWVPAIAERAEKVRAWLPKAIKEAEAELLDGLGVTDRVTLRLVSGLAVWVVVGKMAVKLKILKFKDQVVTDAVRLVLREHVNRQVHRSTPIGEKVIKIVRDYLDRNPSRFPAIAMFGRTDQNNILGYTKGSGHDRVYLFLPGVLEDLLGEKFGLQTALQKLADAGYLLKNGEGSQMQVRVGDQMRKRFYAIRASISFDGDMEVPAQSNG